MLEVRALSKTFGGLKAVEDVDLRVEEGEIVSLIGPNGAGKTTTFHMIVGLIAPRRGRVYLGDEEITTLPMYQRARRGVGYLSQEPSVFRKLTVRQNLQAVVETMGLPKRQQEDRCDVLLNELELTALAGQRADRLSGGETRRLEITRALAREPRVMLMDEPFAGIDPRAVEDIQGMVEGLRRKGISVLITDHNVRETLSITDRSYILSEGRILASGTPRMLADDEEVRRIYLGDRFRLD